MKTVKFIITAVLAVVCGINSYAQMHDHSTMATLKTDTIKVSGNCGMCKSRIEKAAKIDGVTKAEWNKDSKLLILAYNPMKVTKDVVQKKIADVGHDTEKYKAEQKVYDKLPGCCQYR